MNIRKTFKMEQILWKLSHQRCYYYRGVIFHCMYISFVLWVLRWQNIHIWFNYRPISRDEHAVIMLYRSMTLAVCFLHSYLKLMVENDLIYFWMYNSGWSGRHWWAKLEDVVDIWWVQSLQWKAPKLLAMSRTELM